jgi:hypothetical protein
MIEINKNTKFPAQINTEETQEAQYGAEFIIWSSFKDAIDHYGVE